MSRTARVSRCSPSPRSCQTTMPAENNSITESRPKPTRAMEEAMKPAVIATPASATIHAMLAYSSQNPRRRSRASSLPEVIIGLSSLELASLTWRDGLALDAAGADGATHATEDQPAEELTALPGAHPDSRAQLQSGQRHRDTDRADNDSSEREADLAAAERAPDSDIVAAHRDARDPQPT